MLYGAKIGPQNMARLQDGMSNREVSKTFRMEMSVVAELPATLRNLHLRWETNAGLSSDTPRGLWSHRRDFNGVLTNLLQKARDLPIFLDTVVGWRPVNEGPMLHGMSVGVAWRNEY